MQLTNQTPTPAANESYRDFVIRAHQQLLDVIPENDHRNQAVWDAWAAVHGETERMRADQRFSSDQFDKRADVCYFAEHEAQSPGPDGQPVVRKYDAGKLSDIIEENNFRIEDVDAYPTVIDRHTAPSGVRDPSPPRTVGAVGPLRLGMIGRKQPRFAIFADEYIRKDAASEVAARPGRSVEVLTLKANGRSYINPIAAISEAPRLPLPVQFATGEDAAFIERYSVVAPYSMGAPAAALPGGGNTYVQKFDSQTPDQTGNPPASPRSNQESGQMLTDQDVKQLVDAVMGTEQMQFVGQLMQQGGTPPGGADLGAGNAGGANAPAAGGQQFGGGGGMMRYSAADGDESEKIDFSAGITPERYQALVDGQNALVEELEQTRQQMAVMHAERADAIRISQIQDLASRLPVDVEAEKQRCLYSLGSEMNDADFERHIEVVEQYAAKSIEQTPMVPAGELPEAQRSDEEAVKYQADVSAAVRHLSGHYANQGEVKTYHELREEAEKMVSASK